MIDFTKRNLLFSFLGLIAIGLITVSSFAGKPKDDGIFLGNGYPSGPHYNLNLIGKKDNFSCPPPQYLVIADNNGDGDIDQIVGSCDAGDICEQVYGNVIFMPRNENGAADPISITIESGRKGPKSKPGTTEYEVTDWCTQSFPDDGSSPPPWGDGATLRLPYNEYGYAVYARILGKPGEDGGPTFDFTSRELVLVEDEFGNNLLLLGLVDENGAYTPQGDPLTRTSGDGGGKGKGGPKGAKKATDISAIFEYTGDVCFINDVETYCPDFDDTNPEACTVRDRPVCCVAVDLDAGEQVVSCENPDADGFAYCEDSTLTGDTNGDGNCDADENCTFTCELSEITFENPDNDDGENPLLIGDGNCDAGENCTTVATEDVCPVTPVCKYFDGEWMFNIADFVNVLFGVENNGSYIVKLRFYPLPLN